MPNVCAILFSRKACIGALPIFWLLLSFGIKESRPPAASERKTLFMILSDELYFEITFSGAKSEIQKIAKFLTSGGLDEFLEISSDYLNYDDNYQQAEAYEDTSLTVSNDEYGIDIDEFITEDLLDVLCRAAKALHVSGTLYDINDEEYNFKSNAGDAYYINADKISLFNEDEDKDVEDDEDEDALD